MATARDWLTEAKRHHEHGHDDNAIDLALRAIEALIAEAEADRFTLNDVLGRLRDVEIALEERTPMRDHRLDPIGPGSANPPMEPVLSEDGATQLVDVLMRGAVKHAGLAASLARTEPTPATTPSAERASEGWGGIGTIAREPSACDERCRRIPNYAINSDGPLYLWDSCDGTGPAHRPAAAAASAEPGRTDLPPVPPASSVAPAVPTTGRLVAVGTCYSHPTWGDHEHEAGCINWCWSVRYGMSAAPPAPVFALTEWEREHVRIGLAAGKGSLVGTLARLAVRALAALGVPLDGEGSR